MLKTKSYYFDFLNKINKYFKDKEIGILGANKTFLNWLKARSMGGEGLRGLKKKQKYFRNGG